jgi:ABC-2 type transport system ATP-binding protein
MCHRIGIINDGILIASGSLEELRVHGREQATLEDIFMELTGGDEAEELAKFLGDGA